MTRVTRNHLQVGLEIERHERGAPRDRARIVQLYRKDRHAMIAIEGAVPRLLRVVDFHTLAAHWRVAA